MLRTSQANFVGALLLSILALHLPKNALSLVYNQQHERGSYPHDDYKGHAGHDQRDPNERCRGTPERPVRLLNLPSGDVFCLRLPRFLKSPQIDATGTKKFVRTWNDTCGLYGIVVSTVVAAGGGPHPHIHFADDEYFLPGTPGDVVRIHAQAAGDSSDRNDSSSDDLKQYRPGQVPGYNMPAVTVGGIEVPYGGIGYTPIGTPHTWKAVTPLTNFIAIWGYGFSMEAGVNIPVTETNTLDVLLQTSAWGVPTDINAAMFKGLDFVNNKGPIAVPPVTWQDLERLQQKFDAGEKCCTAC